MPTKNAPIGIYNRQLKNVWKHLEKGVPLKTSLSPKDQQLFTQQHVQTFTDADGREFNYFLDAEGHQVFILDLPNKPTKKHELSKHMPRSMTCYERVSGKQGGRNKAGTYGGNHVFRYQIAGNPDIHKQMLIFKQDTSDENDPSKIHHNKVIAEYVGGKLLELFMGEASASIFLGVKPNASSGIPDHTGENIYVSSVFFDNYDDLFRDIYRFNGILPKDTDDRKKFAGSLEKSWFTKGIMDENNECRYTGFARGGLASEVIRDKDTQSANWGVVGKRRLTGPRKKELLEKGALVRLDAGGCLRGLEDRISLHSWINPIKKISLAKGIETQPTAHYREWPRSLRISEESAKEAERLSNFSLDTVQKTINLALEEVSKFYGSKPILSFGNHLAPEAAAEIKKAVCHMNPGAADFYDSLKNNKIEDIPNYDVQENIFKPLIVQATKDFLFQKISNRLTSLKEIALQIKYSLCFNEKNDGFTDKHYNIEELIRNNLDIFMKGQYHFRRADQRYKPFPILPIIFKGAINRKMTKLLLDKVQEVHDKMYDERLNKAKFEAKPIAELQALEDHHGHYPANVYEHANIDQAIKMRKKLPTDIFETNETIVVKKETLHNNNLEEIYSKTVAVDKVKKNLHVLGGQYHHDPLDFNVEHPQQDNYIMTFISASKDPNQKKGCFVELISQTHRRNLKVLELPAEIDRNWLFATTLIASGALKYRYDIPDAKDATEVHELKNIHQLEQTRLETVMNLMKSYREQPPTVTGMTVFLENIDDLMLNIDKSQIETLATQCYNQYTTHCTNNTLGADAPSIPHDNFLKFALAQCLVLGAHQHRIIDISSCQNELLKEAYKLVCKTYGWKCTYKNQYDDQPNHTAVNAHIKSVCDPILIKMSVNISPVIVSPSISPSI